MTSDLSHVAIATALASSGSLSARTAAFISAAIVRGAKWLMRTGPYICQNRNGLVSDALRLKQVTHLFFCDSDIAPPVSALDQLLSHDVDIVMGAYPTYRVLDGHRPQVVWVCQRPGAGRWLPYSDLREELFEADVIGASATLIRTNVFRELPQPWFNVSPTVEPGVVSDDVWFSRLARKHGFKLWVDGNVKCDHIKTLSVGQMFEAARDEVFLNSIGRASGAARGMSLKAQNPTTAQEKPRIGDSGVAGQQINGGTVS